MKHKIILFLSGVFCILIFASCRNGQKQSQPSPLVSDQQTPVSTTMDTQEKESADSDTFGEKLSYKDGILVIEGEEISYHSTELSKILSEVGQNKIDQMLYMAIEVYRNAMQKTIVNVQEYLSEDLLRELQKIGDNEEVAVSLGGQALYYLNHMVDVPIPYSLDAPYQNEGLISEYAVTLYLSEDKTVSAVVGFDAGETLKVTEFYLMTDGKINQVTGESTIAAREAAVLLNGASPEQLGLPVKLSEYNLIYDDDYTEINGQKCYGISAFADLGERMTNMGVFFVAIDGSALYKSTNGEYQQISF